MKATYFAVAAAVALAGMSGTAHAAFKQNSIIKDFNPGQDEILDAGEFLTVIQTGTVDNGGGTADFSFEVSEDILVGSTSGLQVSFEGAGFIDIQDVLLTSPALTGSPTSIIGDLSGTGVEIGPATLLAGVNTLDIDFNADDGTATLTTTLATVPLPAAAWLMIGGLGAIGAYARGARNTPPTA